jgi:hypothetical protein
VHNWNRANRCLFVFFSPSPTLASIWQLKNSGTALNYAQLLTFLQNEIYYQTVLEGRTFDAINQPTLTHGFNLVTDKRISLLPKRVWLLPHLFAGSILSVFLPPWSAGFPQPVASPHLLDPTETWARYRQKSTAIRTVLEKISS